MADLMGVMARLENWLPHSVLAFLIAAFALPAGPDYALVFYVAVLPCTIAAMALGKRPKLHLSFAFAAALVIWSGCTLLWGHDDGHRNFPFLVDTVCTLFYVAALVIVLGDLGWRALVRRVLIIAGAGNAAFSMLIGLVWHTDVARLTGWGVTRHPILGAASMAVPCLLALHGGFSNDTTSRERLLNGAAAIVMAAFILFTDSRGPLLAGATASLFLCAAGSWRRFALPGYAVVFALYWAPSLSPRQAGPTAQPPSAEASEAPVWLQSHGADELARRGTSHRLEIWSESLRLIRERPIIGHGLADNLHLDVGGGEIITFPHDLYLSLMFYSGAVGLALFTAMMLALAWNLLRHLGDQEFPWLAALLINALVAGLTDLGQITKGPGPIWFIVWLPVLFAMTARSHGVAGGISRPAP